MADYASWGWYSPNQWPFMEFLSSTNLDGSGNGLSIDPNTYLEFTIRDANNDGVVYDDDFDGGPRPYWQDAVIGPTTTLYPDEIALYTNSTIVMNGQTITGLDMQVTLFTNGTYGVRIMDWDIPPGHHSDVTSITLGTWNGVEYNGITVSGVDQMFVCFSAGTLIETQRGRVPVELLEVGDMVETLDHGLQPIRWIGKNTIMGLGANAPIRFEPGVLDNDVPCYVSPNHRVLIHGSTPELLYGEEEVLVAAKHLVDGRNIFAEPRPLVEYVHFALDQHEIVVADGLLAETLLPGPQALEMVSEVSRRELMKVFPVLHRGWEHYGPSARLCLSAKEADVLRWALTRERQLEKPTNGRVRPEYTYAH